jgi:hypothetical protein
MKKIIVCIVAVVLFATNIPVKAGGVYEGPEPGKSILGVRAGFSGHYIDLNAVYDYSLVRVWKGTFTVGGVLGCGFGVQKGYKNWFNIPLMARTTYRFNVVVPEWEVYGGVMLGVGFEFNKDNFNPHFAGGILAGTSYYFTDFFGLNLEFDGVYGSSFVSLGLKFRF